MKWAELGNHFIFHIHRRRNNIKFRFSKKWNLAKNGEKGDNTCDQGYEQFQK